jgi:GNAT superfamily N-acetyltransferase
VFESAVDRLDGPVAGASTIEERQDVVRARITVIARSRARGSDDDLLGVAIILTTSPHGGAFYNAFTFVAPEHRGRGLATQMKHRALAGVPHGWLYSWTDVGSYVINAANAGLGYSVIGRQQVWQIRRCIEATPRRPTSTALLKNLTT